MKELMQVDLKLPTEVVQYLLNVLGEQPYKTSAGVIAEIQNQVQPQLNPKPESKEEK